MDEFLELTYDADKPLVSEVFDDFHSRNFQERFNEVRLRAADGRYIWFWFRGTLETIGIDGRPLIISGTTTNVQSKKETEEQLNNQNHQYLALNEELRMTNAELMEANARAEESDRLKTSFLENLSHELRTPMNGIMGFTDLLKDGTPDEDDKNMYIDIIRNSAKQLLGIVSDIMEISKIDTGQVSARMEKVNIFKTVNEVYKIIQKQAEHNRDIVFDFICATECRDIVIVSDEVKLKQIFTNLMNNAVKYTKRGYIRVRLAQDSGSIVFSVEDTGCGILPENIPLIFRRFVRLKDSDNIGATSGAGLGLSIAKSYAELLGGTIDVKSEYGKGSVFTVRLPMKG
jgi:signal transduction histidine kinase